MKKTIYIAGPISRRWYLVAYCSFLLTELKLRLLGFSPVSPMKEIPKELEYEKQVIMGKYLAIGSEYIYLKRNWYKSKGAYRELRAFLRFHPMNNVIWFEKLL
jgi:hypothetical protein